jgi:hypothetical protein
LASLIEQFRGHSGDKFGNGGEQKSFKGNRAALEEKYFQRISSFEGDTGKLRGWLFDLTVATGQVDEGLAGELVRLHKLDDGDKWKPEEDRFLKTDLCEKYDGELYGVLCSVTRGEPKNIVRGIGDAHSDQDGFRAILVLDQRYDQRTTATLLQAFLDAVGQPNSKEIQDFIVGGS